MHKTDPAGIEISVQELIVALRREGKLKPWKSFPNTPAGHQAIVRYLARKGRVVQVCLESTGVYGLDLAIALHAAPGIEVMVANPRAVRHFAQALMQRSKNVAGADPCCVGSAISRRDLLGATAGRADLR